MWIRPWTVYLGTIFMTAVLTVATVPLAIESDTEHPLLTVPEDPSVGYLRIPLLPGDDLRAAAAIVTAGPSVEQVTASPAIFCRLYRLATRSGLAAPGEFPHLEEECTRGTWNAQSAFEVIALLDRAGQRLSEAGKDIAR